MAIYCGILQAIHQARRLRNRAASIDVRQAELFFQLALPITTQKLDIVYYLIMDGLSVAASSFAVLSLATQLADSFKKLYDFWSSFRDAPNDVRTFTKDLKLLSAILSKIELEGKRYGSGSETLDVLESCKEQVASFMTLMRDIIPGFEAESRHTRTWSSLKAAFKKEKILQFRNCLRETKITLILATNSTRLVSLSLEFSRH